MNLFFYIQTSTLLLLKFGNGVWLLIRAEIKFMSMKWAPDRFSEICICICFSDWYDNRNKSRLNNEAQGYNIMSAGVNLMGLGGIQRSKASPELNTVAFATYAIFGFVIISVGKPAFYMAVQTFCAEIETASLLLILKVKKAGSSYWLFFCIIESADSFRDVSQTLAVIISQTVSQHWYGGWSI